jgi:hypothetical protein
VIQVPGGVAFGQQIFSDPEGFRNSISAGSVITPTTPDVDRIQVIDDVVTAIEGALGQMPADGRPTLPANLREQLRISTMPQP